MWGAVPSAAAYLTNVTAVAGGGGFCLALVGDGPPVAHFAAADTTFGPNGCTASLASQSGRVYRMEYDPSSTDSSWTAST